MQYLSSLRFSQKAWVVHWSIYSLIVALLTLGAAPAVRAQCNFTVSTTPAGPLTLCPGGSTALTAAALVPGFNANGSGFNGNVRAVLVQPDGKVLVGGTFTTYNGVNCADNLVRLNANGSLDTGFNGTNAGFDRGVAALALQPDGRVLAGGMFATYNGLDCPDGLARLNADGSLDTRFNGNLAGFAFPIYPTRSMVQALVLQPDGKVLVGGSFTTYNGTTCPESMVRLNANGSLDTGFNGAGVGFNWTVVISEVTALALEPDGQVLVGGNVLAVQRGQLSGGVDTTQCQRQPRHRLQCD